MQPAPLLYPKTCPAEFRCAVCGHERKVEFRDPAGFDEDERLPGRNEWAQKAALESMMRKLDKAARRAIGLVRCPSCGAIDEEARKRAYLRAALPLIGVAPAAFMVGVIALWMIFPVLRGAVLWPILGSLLLTLGLGALVTSRGRQRLIREAEKNVRFLPAQPAAGGADTSV